MTVVLVTGEMLVEFLGRSNYDIVVKLRKFREDTMSIPIQVFNV